MAPSVDILVVGDLLYSGGFWWDDSGSATLVQFLPQPIDIERFVSQQGTELNLADQGSDADRIMALARQERETRQIPQGIDQGDDLRRQTTS